MAAPSRRRRTEDDAAPSALENLPPLVFKAILEKAGARGAAALACASATLRAAASAEAHWRQFCNDDIGIDAPLDPDGRPLRSFKEAYRFWFQSFRMYPLPLVKRVKSFWNSLKSWLSEYYPDALESLAEGLPDIEIRLLEHDLRCQLPLPTKLLYRFCNGQIWNKDLPSCGIIGGYESNFDMVNVHLLPLKEAVERAELLSRENSVFRISNYIVVAASSYVEKTFLLDCLGGQLYVGTKNLISRGETMPCVPYSLIRLHIDHNNHMPQDGLLLWLEEHLRRLQGGLIKVQGCRYKNGARHISLYPKAPPSCSSAITSGIKVCASAVFAPEISAPSDDPCEYVYQYCIKFSLPEACIVDGKRYSSCKFKSRRLTVRTENDVSHDEEYQGLRLKVKQGVDMVKYGCCTLSPLVPASIEGSATFVPLSNHGAEGNEFVVNIAPFPLEPPEYIF